MIVRRMERTEMGQMVMVMETGMETGMVMDLMAMVVETVEVEWENP